MPTITIDAFLAANTAKGCGGIGVRGRLVAAGPNYVSGNQSVGVTAELLTAEDVTGANALQCYLNEDAANAVVLYADGATGAVQIARLLPGQFAVLLSPATPAIGAKAETAEVLVKKVIFEDVSIEELVLYRPRFPVPGRSITSLAIQAQYGAQSIVFSQELEEDVEAAGVLGLNVSDAGTDLLWPAGAGLVGGDGYGTLLALNPSADYDTTLAGGSGSASPFGRLLRGRGFAMLPISGLVMPYAVTPTQHEEARLITRRYLVGGPGGGGGGGTVATPTFSPSSGSYTDSVEVTISCATEGATIHYTTNGSTPTSESPEYSAPFTLTATTTVRAIGVKSGMADSTVAVKTYTRAYPVRWGSSTSETLDEAGITGLANSSNKTSPAGGYTFAAPGSPEKYFYLAWPNSFASQPRATDGFTTGGMPMTGDLAGSAQGYTESQNGWPYMLVTVGGISHRVYRTLYPQSLEATITVNA